MATRRGSKKVVKGTSHPSLTHTFAARLRQVRTERNWSLETVIDQGAGGSPGRLSKLERAIMSPTLRSVEELARVLEIDPIDLFIDPTVNARHRVVDASGRASKAALAAASVLLEPGAPREPTVRQVRAQLDALAPWARAAVSPVIEACAPRSHGDAADVLLDLTGPQLAAVAAVIDTLERVVPAVESSPTTGTLVSLPLRVAR
jgi:transcriptional regulator with XRE-family HTH domain